MRNREWKYSREVQSFYGLDRSYGISLIKTLVRQTPSADRVEPETLKPAVERSAVYQSIWALSLFTGILFILRQCLHKLAEALGVIGCQGNLEGMSQ